MSYSLNIFTFIEYSKTLPQRAYTLLRFHCQYIKPCWVASLICSSNKFRQMLLTAKASNSNFEFEFNTLTSSWATAGRHTKQGWSLKRSHGRGGGTDSISTLFLLPLFLTALSNVLVIKQCYEFVFWTRPTQPIRRIDRSTQLQLANVVIRARSFHEMWVPSSLVSPWSTRYYPMTSRSSPRTTGTKHETEKFMDRWIVGTLNRRRRHSSWKYVIGWPDQMKANTQTKQIRSENYRPIHQFNDFIESIFG